MDYERPEMDYEKPEITDHGNLVELTAGCLGSVSADTFADVNFPAGPSGALICGP